MPDYEFQMPDGKTVVIPFDTTPNDAVLTAVVKDYMNRSGAKKPAPVGMGDVRAREARETPVRTGPSDAQIGAYRQRWFSDAAGGSVPYDVMRQYMLAPDRNKFQFPKGFSPVGIAAVKREYEERQLQSKIAERKSKERQAGMLGQVASGFDPEGAMAMGAAMESLTGQQLPSASRRMTAARTGQRVSQALPLGLDPAGMLAPNKGFGGAGRKLLATGLTAEGLSAVAAAPLALPFMNAVPGAGLLMGAAGMAMPISTLVKEKDPGKALAEAIVFGVPGGLAMRPGLQSGRAGLARRIAARDARIAALTPEPAPVVPRPRKPLLPTPEEDAAIGVPSTTIPSIPPQRVDRVPRRIAPAPAEEPPAYQSKPLLRVQETVSGRTEPFDIAPPSLGVPEVQAATPPSGAGIAPFTAAELEGRRLLTRGLESLQTRLDILVKRKDAQIRQYGSVAPDLDEAIVTLVNAIERQGGQVPFEYRRGVPLLPTKKKGVAPQEVTPEVPPEIAPEVAPAIPVAQEQPMPAMPSANIEVEPMGTQAPGVVPSIPPPSASATPDIFDSNVLQIERRIQEAMASSVGIPGQVPQRGSQSNIMRSQIKAVIDNPEGRAASLDRIRSVDWDNPAEVASLTTADQVAAAFRERELLPLVEQGNKAALSEYIKMLQAIVKVGSRKGFDLAMQRLFKYTLDLSDVNAYDKAVAVLTTTMKNNGASDEQVMAALNRVRPKVQEGILRFTTGKKKVDDAADAAEAAIAAARASGRKVTDESVMEEYTRRLEQLGADKVPAWAGKSSPLLSPAVRMFRDGVRKFEDFRARVKQLYGDDIPEDRVKALFDEAVIRFKQDNTQIDDIMSGLTKSIRDEAWSAQSKGKRLVKTLTALNNIERLVVLGLDLGIFGVQFGPAKASRPALLFAQLPSTAKASVGERIAASTIGGVPSPRAAFSMERGGGIAPSAIKAFVSEKGQAAANAEIEILGRMRYPEFDDPFAEAGLLGFRPSDLEGGALSGEVSFDTQMALDRMPKWMASIYGKSQRATDTGLRYGRALIFDQMMRPFSNLPADQKLEAMKGVATFVNTLTGGSTYGQTTENIVKVLGQAFTAPRYYMSNFEMATGAPFARTYRKDLPAKERAKIAGMVATEYGRLAAALTTAKLLLAPKGIEVVSDPFDTDFGTARYKLTNGTETTVAIVPGFARYIPLLLQSGSGLKSERAASGAPSQFKKMSARDRVFAASQFLYGKSTMVPRTVFSMIPATLPEGAEYMGPGMGSISQSEFRSPGGVSFSPREAMTNIPMTLSYAGQRLPLPLALKQISQNIPVAMGDGDQTQGKKLLLLARTGQAFLGGFGENVQVKMTPEMVKSVLGNPNFNKMSPYKRERLRLKLMKSVQGEEK